MSSDKEQQKSQLKELINRGKEQGFLTYAEVNDHLPADITDPDQIEDIMAGAKPRAPKDWDEPQSPKKKSTNKTSIKGPVEEL